jgi:glycerol dehydrogenase-like iron-containing ADH family enzyme
MKYPKIAAKKLHGEVIAVTTLTAARLQKRLLESCAGKLSMISLGVTLSPSKGDSGHDLKNFFGQKTAAECKKEYDQKILMMSSAKQINALSCKELQKIYFSETHLKKIFSHFKLKTSTKSLGLSSQQYKACVDHAKFIRNRFTCLDVVIS